MAAHSCFDTVDPSRFVTKGFVVVDIERRVLVYAALIFMAWGE